MKNLRITNIEKDVASFTLSGDFKLRIKFEITGNDGSEESKVLFAGQYRIAGGSPTSIYSDKISLTKEAEHSAIIPSGNEYIPGNAEVSIWGMVDTDFKAYSSYL